MDTSKANYAVFTGVQIHNWAADLNRDDDVPSMEFISLVGKVLVYMVCVYACLFVPTQPQAEQSTCLLMISTSPAPPCLSESGTKLPLAQHLRHPPSRARATWLWMASEHTWTSLG